MKAINKVVGQKSTVIENLETILEQTVICADEELAELDEKIKAVQLELVDRATSSEGYEDLARESDRLNEEKQKILITLAEDKGRQEKKAELIDFLHEQTTEFDEFDDDESDYLVIGSESEVCDALVAEEPKPVEPSKVEEPKLEPAPEVASEPAKVAEPEKKVVESVPDVNVGTVIAEDKLEAQKCVSEVSKVKSKPQVRTTGSRKAEGRFVNSLKKAITINDRIRYTRELFGGDMELMNKVIVHLDGLSSLKEATDYIESIFDWDELDEAVIEFYDLLEMRFS
jgi:hypothetical protein